MASLREQWRTRLSVHVGLPGALLEAIGTALDVVEEHVTEPSRFIGDQRRRVADLQAHVIGLGGIEKVDVDRRRVAGVGGGEGEQAQEEKADEVSHGSTVQPHADVTLAFSMQTLCRMARTDGFSPSTAENVLAVLNARNRDLAALRVLFRQAVDAYEAGRVSPALGGRITAELRR